MQEQIAQRRLATIVAVDVAGYAARTEADEEAATAEVAALGQAVKAVCARHGGRLFNSAGDGFMLEFPTVSGALEAAEALAAEAGAPVRVGVHLGEVRVTGDGDLLGHGVNVAARIQALAPPRGVLVSADVRRAIRGPLADRLADRGKVKLDKMDETIEVFALAAPGAVNARTPVGTEPRVVRRGLLVGAGVAAAGAAGYAGFRFLKPPPKRDPLVAVLPFDNLSPDPQLGYFADGLSEDILNALIRSGGLRVTARSSSFTFRGPAKAKAGAVLKADYVLDGSVLRDGQRLRVNAQLNDTATRETLWSERYDREVGQGLQIEDDIAGQVADALKVRIAAQAAPAAAAINPVAYDLYLKGRQISRDYTLDNIERSNTMLREAVEIEPNFAAGWYELANNYYRWNFLLPAARQEPNFVAGREAARKAIALDPKNGAAFGILAQMTPRFGHWGEVDRSLEQAARLSPNDGDILNWRSAQRLSTGRVRAAAEVGRRGQALNPLDLFTNHTFTLALIYAGLFREAEAMTDRLASIWPDQVATYWDRFTLLFAAGRNKEAAAWMRRPKHPSDPTPEQEVLARSALAVGGPAGERAAAVRANLDLAALGLGYAVNSIIIVARLGDLDAAQDLARSIYLSRGSVKIDRSVQFRANSRYPMFGEPDVNVLFHPFVGPLRRTGELNDVFDAVGLTAFWLQSGLAPDP